MGRPKKNSDPFEDLDSEFKDKIAVMDEAGIRNTIATVALNEFQNQKNRDDDQDLKDKKEQAKFAGEQYREATKMNKLRIKFARRVLEDQGKPV